MSVMVVDDNDDIRESFAFLIRQLGYEVETAADGAEALAKLETRALPNLILLDLMMPVMDGWQLRRRMLARPEWASIPVVLLSCAGGLEREAAALGALDYLQKPVDLSTVYRLVAQAHHA